MENTEPKPQHRHKWKFTENYNVVRGGYRAYYVVGVAATTKRGLYECECGAQKWGKPNNEHTAESK